MYLFLNGVIPSRNFQRYLHIEEFLFMSLQRFVTKEVNDLALKRRSDHIHTCSNFCIMYLSPGDDEFGKIAAYSFHDAIHI